MFCSQMTYVVIMTQYEAHTFWQSSPLKFRVCEVSHPNYLTYICSYCQTQKLRKHTHNKTMNIIKIKINSRRCIHVLLLPCVGLWDISSGALLSMLADVVVSPLRYANRSFLSGRRITLMFTACWKESRTRSDQYPCNNETCTV